MMDKVSKDIRSKNMRAIKSVSKLEVRVSSALWRKGLRFRRNVKTLYGKPDFAIQKYKVVIFIDSCFWHSCPIHGNTPKTNTVFWNNKLNRNRERDKEVTSHYKSLGWNILRVWEHELKEDFNKSINTIQSFILHAKKTH